MPRAVLRGGVLHSGPLAAGRLLLMAHGSGHLGPHCLCPSFHALHPQVQTQPPQLLTPASPLGRGRGRWTKWHGREQGPAGGREDGPRVSPRPSSAPTPASQEGRAAQYSCCFRHLLQRGLLWLSEGPGWGMGGWVPAPVPAVRACCLGVRRSSPTAGAAPGMGLVMAAPWATPGPQGWCTGLFPPTPPRPLTPLALFSPRTLSRLGLFLKNCHFGKVNGCWPVPSGLRPQLHCPVEGVRPHTQPGTCSEANPCISCAPKNVQSGSTKPQKAKIAVPLPRRPSLPATEQPWCHHTPRSWVTVPVILNLS